MDKPCHVKVFAEDGAFGAWPANGGIWMWGDEILVGYTRANHQNKPNGHTYDRRTARRKFARSRDGGLTWAQEDAYAAGITAEEWDHQLPSDMARPARPCVAPADFDHQDFVLTFGRMNNANGPSCFYVSSDRGHRWQGPYIFPDLDTPGVASRTEYFVEGRHALLAFLTTGKANGREGRVACARTDDGGVSWRRVSWLGDELTGERDFAIMPAAVRLGPDRFYALIRQREGDPVRAGLMAYLSEDHASTWRQIPSPHLGNLPGQCEHNIYNPPALVKLRDGRLCVAYGVRETPSRMCVMVSEDEGLSWSAEAVVRGNDGACSDMGYPRMVQRADGKLVLIYYYNHALADGARPYRYIAASLFDPPV